MPACMAGTTIIGAFVASTVQQSMSSAMPAAILAIMSAVAGAITTTSAASAKATCSTLYSEANWNILVTTGLPVILRNVSGVTNSVAASVIITSTLAPTCANWLANSAAL